MFVGIARRDPVAGTDGHIDVSGRAARPVPTLGAEHALLREGAGRVAGIDEVGRGALAGPVAVGVTVVGPSTGSPPDGLADSKLLTPSRREELAPLIEAWCVCSAVGWASAAEIDEHGIVPALRLAAERALVRVVSVVGTIDAVILDGSHDWLTRARRVEAGQGLPSAGRVVVRARADQTCASVSAASVIAKVARDTLMRALHRDHPQFGWESNKGYGAAVHRAAIAATGPSPHHRRSFRLG